MIREILSVLKNYICRERNSGGAFTITNIGNKPQGSPS